MSSGDPFEQLLDIEQRSTNNAAGLPAAAQQEDEWTGVGFRIGNSRLIARMGEVKEILDLPQFTPVPGVKSWVVGVANVRGSLLPIFDLKGYIMGEDIKQRHNGRVIVIDYKGFNTGLVVEEVYGLRHFMSKDQTDDMPEVDEELKPYVNRAFRQNAEHWPIFSFRHMTSDERFAKASL